MTKTTLSQPVLKNQESKYCCQCKLTKPLSEFYLITNATTGKKDRYATYCKICNREKNKAWVKNNKEKYQTWRESYKKNNKDKIKRSWLEWKKKNNERLKQYGKLRRLQNADKIKAALKKYKSQPKAKEQYREYNKKRRSRLDARLNDRISNSIRSSLKKGVKNKRKWESIVGYTSEDLKKHIEKQFKDGMSWENFGEWHIDHKIPISAFNFKTVEDYDFKRCWSLKNLQPLWAIDNLKKNNKLEKHFQPSLI